jgi:hypothetical protein
MAEQRHVFRLARSLVISLPRLVQLHLEVKRGAAVYWHVKRKGEAVLTAHEQRTGGHPEGLSLQRRLTAALADVDRLRQRNEARDRTMYAEGYNLGYLAALDRLTSPTGKGATRALRRRGYAYGLPRTEHEAGIAPRRRARRAVVVGSVDAIPQPNLPSSPVVVDGGAGTSGAEPPGAPLLT